MASLSTTEKKKQVNRFRSDSDAVTLPEAVANPLKDYILESARTIHRTELTMAFLRWMLSVVAVFFSLVLIDQWLWPLSTVARYVVWVGFIGGTVLWFTTMVLPLIGRTIHPHYAARQIETTLPEMKEGLITWVQLSGSDTPPPKSVLNAVGRYVAKQLKGQDIASVIDQLNPLKLAAALMGLTLIGAIYLATSPKNVPATIQRLLMPWANIAPATRVQIVSITPGDTSVIQGSNASIAIQVRGWQRQDKATIRYATDDGQTVDQRVAMSSDIEGLSYRIELGKSFGGILQPMHYWVEAGDAIAGPFAIQVQAIPLSTLERVDYVYPAYTRMSPRTIESDGRIEGPEGTRVRVTAKGNQPMKSARVEFDSTLAQDGSYQPEWIRDLQVDDRSISGDWILEVNEKRSNPSHYQYRIRSTNMLGESAPEPVVYPMTVVADMAPEVDFAAEIKDIIEVAENSSIDLEMRANDPDFGLVKLVLDGTVIGSKSRGSVLQETLIEDVAGLTGQSVHTLAVAPKQLGLQSGDKIDLVLTASDNRHDPQTSKPAPNIVKSRVVTLKVTPPVKNPNLTEDASGGTQKDPSKNSSKAPSKSDDTPKSKSPSDPQQPNKKTSKENPDNSNEKPSGEQKPNKQDQSKQDQSKQAADQTSNAQKEDSQRNKPQKQTPSQPKPNTNQPKDNATDQPQDKDQPPRDPKQQPDNKKTEPQQPKDSQSKDQSSKEQSGKEQSGKDQSGENQGAGDDPSGASQASDSSGGQPQGSQKSAGGKSGGQSSDSSGDASNDASGEPSGAQSQGAQGTGKESPSGSQSPGMKSDPSNPNEPQSGGSKADPSKSDAADGNASDGDASDGQAPTHDGEAFERLQKILNQSKSNDGANGKPTRDQGPSEDKTEPTKDPQGANSGKPSGDQSKTNKSPEKTPDESSNQDNATDQKSGDSSSGQSSNKQQSGDPKDASASDGNKSDSQGNNSQASDSQPNNQQKKSDSSKSNSAKSDSAQSNSGDKSKANESNGGDDSKAATDKGNSNQSKNSPNNNASGEESPSGQDAKPNDSKANESNSKQGRDKSESETPNNAKPENSDVKNSQSESNESESNESGGNQPNTSNSKSSDTAGSNSKSGKSGEKGSSSDSSKQDAANSSSSKSNEGDSTKGNPSKSDPTKGDSKPSEGKSQDASPKGSQSEGSGQAKGSSGQSKSSSGSNKSSGASAGGSQGLNSSGQSGTAAGSGAAGGNESSASSSKETTEYAKSATDLVLDSLKRQREQPDPELLKRMGWNKEQMQAFVDRWQAARDQAMIDPSKKKDYEDMLQSLGLVPQTGNTRAVLGRTDGLSGIREEGSRVRPPESLRERFEAFRKASQQPGTK